MTCPTCHTKHHDALPCPRCYGAQDAASGYPCMVPPGWSEQWAEAYRAGWLSVAVSDVAVTETEAKR